MIRGMIVASFLLIGLTAVLHSGGRAANVTIALSGSAFGGWGFSSDEETNPGPTIVVSLGDRVTMQLTSSDRAFHDFWIDYDGDGVVDPGEPISDPFGNTAGTFTFDATVEGTFTYYCSIHCGSPCNPASSRMRGTWVTTAAPIVTIASPGATTSWTGGNAHDILFNVASPEPSTTLLMWVNYSHSGGAASGPIAGPVTGTANPNVVPWTPTGFSATDVVINVTAVDASGRRGFQRSAPFEVDSVRPAVASMVPVAGATDVATNAQIRVTWTEGMSRTTTDSAGAFGLLQVPDNTWVSGTISWSADSVVMTFAPAGPLRSTTVYRVHVNTTARDDSIPGNLLMAPALWTFTTGSGVDLTSPVVSPITATPATQSEGGPVNLTAMVTDDVGVGGVTAHVTGPLLDVNLSMANSGGNVWYTNRTYGAQGSYSAIVWATDGAGNLASRGGSFEIIDTTAPQPPPRVVVQLTPAGRAGLSWDPSPSPDVTGYHVHRGASSGGPYSRVTSSPLPPVENGGGFLDGTADPGRTYYYVVTAIDDAGNESPFSMEVSITYPQAPVDAVPYVGAAGGAAIIGIGGYLMWRRRHRSEEHRPPKE